MKKDLYKILGIDKGSNKEDIKKAYRNKAKKYHPDHKGDSELFTEINKAHSILIDDKKRRHYDETGRADENPEDKINTIACDRLIKYFLEIIDAKKNKIFETDIIGIIESNISNYIEQCKQTIQKTKQEEKHLKKIKKRIKFKGRNVNLFVAVIEDRIKSCKFVAGQAKLDIEIFNKMKNILENFEFDFDENDFKTPTSIWTTYIEEAF